MNLSETIDILQNAPQPLRERISWCAKATAVAIYGAGLMGRQSYSVLTDSGIVVKYFLDQGAQPGQILLGIPVLRPDDPSIRPDEREETHVVVAIFNCNVRMPSLHDQIKKMGWSKVTTFLEFYQPFARELGNRYWLTHLGTYRTAASALKATSELWADDISRDLFERTLHFRATGDYTVVPEPDLEGQYFPEDIPQWPLPLRFVDCGAFDGDTLNRMISKKIPVEALAAFEPDGTNFAKLSATIARMAVHEISVTAWPCGLASETIQMRFEGGNGAGSTISSIGSQFIQCVTLDQAIPSFRPNVIKMDIEGAEYAALLGARETIRKHRPGLAICLYHRPEHIWQIPLMLRDWKLDFQFFLRSHGYNGFDLVLYALPAQNILK